MNQCTVALGRLATRSQDKRAIEKLEKMLASGTENHAVLTYFSEILNQFISTIIRGLEDGTHSKVSPVAETPTTEISSKVNDSLQQLLNHLAIPQDLDEKRDHIKVSLEHRLNGENLSKVIDGLTELVVDAFNMEQNRFKGFLQQLTNQLQDFDSFLKSSSEHRSEAAENSQDLEHEIQGDIQQIKSHLDTSTSIEELSMKIRQNLETIGDRIKEYRAIQRVRDQEYETQLHGLQSKLSESEHNAEEIKSLLSFQKYRINHDSLTSLPNREAYDEHILESLQRWKQHGQLLSLAVGDVDHFKRINDTFGHLAGDKVLKKVASLFKASTRDVDFIARFGGEEFVFIFEKTSSDEAFAILEKLRKEVEDCQFVYRDKIVDVTVSFGLTTVVQKDDIESLFNRADKAMYKAKNAGRNRTEVL